MSQEFLGRVLENPSQYAVMSCGPFSEVPWFGVVVQSYSSEDGFTFSMESTRALFIDDQGPSALGQLQLWAANEVIDGWCDGDWFADYLEGAL